MRITNYFFLLIVLTSFIQNSFAQKTSNNIHIVGEMRNVMWKGQLQGSIHLDTINKKNLYGLGPVEYLSGEILVINGKAYQSIVLSDSTMSVKETFDIKAPFFGYANIEEWKSHTLPDSIITLKQLESYLDQLTKNHVRPFFFQLKGQIEKATIHIVNLPKGSKVSSPDEAHQGLVNYYLSDTAVEILGFFSTSHKAIFTHHDTFVHLHLITTDKQKMGHLDEIKFKPGEIKVYLPQ